MRLQSGQPVRHQAVCPVTLTESHSKLLCKTRVHHFAGSSLRDARFVLFSDSLCVGLLKDMQCLFMPVSTRQDRTKPAI